HRFIINDNLTIRKFNFLNKENFFISPPKMYAGSKPNISLSANAPNFFNCAIKKIIIVIIH
ncbi:hypothetical protein DPP33_23495, partial [Salmonella enterica subsp. enterica serovar Typhi]|nr:hypothetical protein [Salmonella enterica subsp. enterica serovar Typhi]